MQRRDVLRLLGTLPLGMAAASRLAHAGVDLQALNEDIAINDAAAGYDLFAHFTGALRDTLAGLYDGALVSGFWHRVVMEAMSHGDRWPPVPVRGPGRPYPLRQQPWVSPGILAAVTYDRTVA